MTDYVVEKVDDVKLATVEPLTSMDWMSPFVWQAQGLYWIMMRGVPKPLGPDDPSGLIWCGSSPDGLTFTMDPGAAISPGPDEVDAGGVEDPTVELIDDGLMVYFTGVEADRQQGSLLVATGPDLNHLKKRAVMLKAPKGQGNIKEATLAQASDGSWRMFYEYAADGASRIGMATCAKSDGPWVPVGSPVPVRSRQLGQLAFVDRPDHLPARARPGDVLQWRDPRRALADWLGRFRSGFLDCRRPLRRAAGDAAAARGSQSDRYRLRGLGPGRGRALPDALLLARGPSVGPSAGAWLFRLGVDARRRKTSDPRLWRALQERTCPRHVLSWSG